MKNFKRALASILAVAMLATSVNVGYAASSKFADVDKQYSASVSRLANLDILTGYEDGSFKPEGTITRAEVAAVMVRMLGKDKLASYSAGLSQFADMTGHWANGYVNVAASSGLVKGYEDGTYKPDEKVTYAEVITMMVRSLGAGEAIGSTGKWPTNFLNFAVSESLTSNVAVIPNAPATRGDVAKIADKTLDAPMWVATGYSSDGTQTYQKSGEDKIKLKTLFTEKLDLTKYELVKVDQKLDKSRKFKIKVENGSAGEETSVVDGVDATSDRTVTLKLPENVDGTAIVELTYVNVYVNKSNEAVSVVVNEDANISVVAFKEIKDVTSRKVKVVTVDGDEEEYDVATGAVYKVNSQTVNGTALKANGKYKVGNIVLNDDEDVIAVNAIEYNQVIAVKKVDEKNNKITSDNDYDTKTGNSNANDIDFKDAVYSIVDKEGKGLSMTDIEEGDVLIYGLFKDTSNKTNYYEIMNLGSEAVTGTIERVYGSEIKVDGTKYAFNESIAKLANWKRAVKDNEVDIYLDAKDNIVLLELAKAGGKTKKADLASYGIIDEVTVFKTGEQMDETATDYEVTNDGETDLDKYGIKINVNFMDGTESKKELDIEELEDDLLFAFDADGVNGIEDDEYFKVQVNELSTGATANITSTTAATRRAALNSLVTGGDTILFTTKDLRALLLDKMVEVEVDGGKFVIREVEGLFDVDFGDNYVEEDDKAIVGGLSLSVKTEKTEDPYITLAGKRIYFKDVDMAILVQDANGFDAIEPEDLNDNSGLVNVVAINFDADKRTVDGVYIPLAGNILKYSSSDAVGLVTNMTYIEKNSNNKNVYEITVLTMDGEESYTYVDKDGDYSRTDVKNDVYVGAKLAFTAKEEEISKIARMITVIDALKVANRVSGKDQLTIGKITDAAKTSKDYFEVVNFKGGSTTIGEVDKHEKLIFVDARVETVVKATTSGLTISSEELRPELAGLVIELDVTNYAAAAPESVSASYSTSAHKVTVTIVTDDDAAGTEISLRDIEEAINDELDDAGFTTGIEFTAGNKAALSLIDNSNVDDDDAVGVTASFTLAITSFEFDKFELAEQDDISVTDADNDTASEVVKDKAHTVYVYITSTSDESDSDEQKKAVIVIFDSSEY